MMTTKRGIYIHIPFCNSKCTYCDFYSVSKDTETVQKYVDAVVAEIGEIASKYPTVADTVYIGGGTPSVLSPFLLEKIVTAVYANFGNAVKEFTMEANPCSCEHIEDYRAMGINRLSLGVQSLNDRLLRVIGRKHTADIAIGKLEELGKVFDNVSADLMVGLPGQSVDDVSYAVTNVAPLVKHISLYMLKLSDTVPMSLSIKRGELTLPDDDYTVDMYDTAYSIMQENGFSRYEISNFSHNGYQSAHNLKYWHRDEYIGIGCAAHGFIGSYRYNNPCSIEAYIKGQRFGADKAELTRISREDALFEKIMLAFRLPEGLDLKAVNSEFGIDFESKYAEQLEILKLLLVFDNGRVALAEDKLLLESAVAREFLP